MFIVINRLSVKPEFAEAVAAAFLENYGGIEAVPGFCGFRFLHPEDPATTPFVVETAWQSPEAFDGWKQSPHFRASHAGMGQFRDAFYAPPQMQTYRLAADIPLTNAN